MRRAVKLLLCCMWLRTTNRTISSKYTVYGNIIRILQGRELCSIISFLHYWDRSGKTISDLVIHSKPEYLVDNISFRIVLDIMNQLFIAQTTLTLTEGKTWGLEITEKDSGELKRGHYYTALVMQAEKAGLIM